MTEPYCWACAKRTGLSLVRVVFGKRYYGCRKHAHFTGMAMESLERNERLKESGRIGIWAFEAWGWGPGVTIIVHPNAAEHVPVSEATAAIRGVINPWERVAKDSEAMLQTIGAITEEFRRLHPTEGDSK